MIRLTNVWFQLSNMQRNCTGQNAVGLAFNTSNEYSSAIATKKIT
jgi:hypothetical protein